MIKTIMYNDMSSYSYEQLKDEEFMFNSFKEFIESGGNLNLPVLGYDKKIINFEKWFVDNIDNSVLFQKLIHNNYIENPFSFIIDDANKTVIDRKNYGLYWLKEKYEKYQPFILEGIAQLAEDISQWDFKIPVKLSREERRSFLSTDISRQILESKTTSITYRYTDYNNEYNDEKYSHPLVFILDRLQDTKILQVILDSSPNYKKIWQDETMIEDTIGTRYGRVDNVDKAYLLYKYEVNDAYFTKEENRYIMTSIFKHAIYLNDIDFIKENLKKFSIKDVEELESTEDLFIPKSRSKEMTSLLINNGAFIEGKLDKGSYEVNVIKAQTSAQSLEVILDYSKKLRDEVVSRPEVYYNLMTEVGYRNNMSLETMKLLITKYHFPLQKFDMFYPVKEYWKNYPEIFNWMIDHGARPQQCNKFISSCVNERSDGLKVLRNLQKSKQFNCYEPDPIFNILRSEPTKEFINWIEKAPPEKFLEETVNGFPAWWGVSNMHGMHSVLSKIKNIEQNSSNGLSLFYFIARVGTKNKYNDFSFDNLLSTYKAKKPNQTINFNISGIDEHGRNMFHYLFRYEKYKRENFYPNVIDFMMEHTSCDVGPMICQEDKNGQIPLELMYYSIKNSNMHAVIYPVKKILVSSLVHINFDKTISAIENEEQFKLKDKSSLEKISVYEALDRMMGKNEDFKRVLNKSYEKFVLYKNLNSNLGEKNSTVNKIKI